MRKKLIIRICNRLKRECRILFEKAKYYLLYPVATMIYRNREVYIVSERGTDARDNGYCFFKYLCKNHPELETYYIIDEKSPDIEKVRSLGNILYFRSLKHYMLFIGAKYKISSHIMGYSPDFSVYIRMHQKKRIPGYHIFLQHGIIKDNIKGLYKESTGVDIFICGAKPEYDVVKSNFHYINDEVKYTGLARYDFLQSFELKKQILVMPTWRVSCANMSMQEFSQCNYFTNWNAFIHSAEIAKVLEKMDMTMIFYPHYEMQKYIEMFSSNNPRVIIADFAHYDVQTLLKESKLLITDFSSVFFDFAYMLKPCVYFQFDREEFFSGHYEKGYFDYDIMGFGEVALNLADAEKTVCSYLEDECKMKSEYEICAKKFFPLHDNHNCERIFQTIKELP